MEIIIIAVVGLIFIGPSKLPDVARQFGKFFVKFRSATQEARQAVDDVVRQAEREVAAEEASKIREALQLESPNEDEALKELELLDKAHENQAYESEIPEHEPKPKE